MADVSSNRLYLGNLPQNATKADIETHFANHGSGEIVETKLMNGFGFVEYRDGNDARDAVPQLNGSEFMGNRLVVQFARGGNRPRDMPPYERPVPRTRRTVYRLKLSGLPPETSWQDLKDFARQDGLDVVYSEVSRERDGSGFVEYETEDDLKTAVDKIDARDFKGQPVTAVAEIQPERPRDRFRSRSPPPYRRGGGGYYNNGPPGGYDDYRDRRGPPPRGYSPRGDRGGYRERSPGPRGGRDYYARDRYDRSPPPPPRSRGPPADDYPPPRGRYADDGYPPRGGGGGSGYGGGRSGGYAGGAGGGDDAAYGNGHRGSYEGRAPASPPRRQRSPGGRGGYEGGGGGGGGYDRRAY